MKIALVTGGNSGIGYAIARMLKKHNYDVYIAGRDTPKLIEVSGELNINYIATDLGNHDEVGKLAHVFENRNLDVLVNNAGIATPNSVENYSLDEISKLININLVAPILLTKYLLPSLERANNSCIVNISSIITKRGVPGFGIYSATKGGIESFTKTMAIELAPKGIRVNAICPGAIDTPMFSKLGRSENEVKIAKQNKIKQIPMKRFGTADEVAHVVLSQIKSTYVTGAVWNVDGGVDT